MAITINKAPTDKHAAYNLAVFEFTTTQTTVANFRFYVELKQSGNLLTTPIKLPKMPNVHKAMLDVSRIVQSFVENQFLEVGQTMNLTKALLDYTFHVGEEYSSEWQYSDYNWNDSASPFNGYTKLVSDNVHSFVVGDQIQIVQSDGGVLKPAISGLHTVVEVPSNKQIVINITWVGDGVAVGGVVSYADGRKILNKNLANVSKTALNVSYDKYWFDRFIDGMEFTGTLLKWACITSDFRVMPGFDFRLNIFDFDLTLSFIEITTDDGFYGEINTTYYKATQVMITDDLDFIDDPNRSKLITENTNEIRLRMFGKGEDNLISKTFVFYVNRVCPVDRVDLLFVDNFGSWLPMYFTRVSERRIDSLKETILDYTEKVKTVGAKQQKGMILRSEVLNEAELQMFDMLITSPSVKMKINGYWEDVYLTTTSAQTANNRLRKTKEITLNYSVTNDLNV